MRVIKKGVIKKAIVHMLTSTPSKIQKGEIRGQIVDIK